MDIYFLGVFVDDYQKAPSMQQHLIILYNNNCLTINKNKMQ